MPRCGPGVTLCCLPLVSHARAHHDLLFAFAPVVARPGAQPSASLGEELTAPRTRDEAPYGLDEIILLLSLQYVVCAAAEIPQHDCCCWQWRRRRRRQLTEPYRLIVE